MEDSPDELTEEIESRKPSPMQPSKNPSKAKALTTRSRSVLGCDQIGIETLVSMLSSGGSDSEKEEQQTVQAPTQKTEAPRVKANMLRKTGIQFKQWLRSNIEICLNICSIISR